MVLLFLASYLMLSFSSSLFLSLSPSLSSLLSHSQTHRQTKRTSTMARKIEQWVRSHLQVAFNGTNSLFYLSSLTCSLSISLSSLSPSLSLCAHKFTGNEKGQIMKRERWVSLPTRVAFNGTHSPPSLSLTCSQTSHRQMKRADEEQKIERQYLGIPSAP